MVALLDGGRMKPLTRAEASQAIEDIFALHARFLTAHHVDAPRAARRYKSLRSTTGIGLVRLARERVRSRHLRTAGQLLASAFRLYPPALIAGMRRIAARRLQPHVLSRTE